MDPTVLLKWHFTKHILCTSTIKSVAQSLSDESFPCTPLYTAHIWRRVRGGFVSTRRQAAREFRSLEIRNSLNAATSNILCRTLPHPAWCLVSTGTSHIYSNWKFIGWWSVPVEEHHVWSLICLRFMRRGGFCLNDTSNTAFVYAPCPFG